MSIEYDHTISILGALRVDRARMLDNWLAVFHHQGSFPPSHATIGSIDPRKTLLEFWAVHIARVNDAVLAVRQHQASLLVGTPFERQS